MDETILKPRSGLAFEVLYLFNILFWQKNLCEVYVLRPAVFARLKWMKLQQCKNW